MEHSKIDNILQHLRLDPTPQAWNRIEGNLKNIKRKKSIYFNIAVAASFIAILSIILIQINFNNSYEIKFVDSRDLNENYEFYNIEYSNVLTKAYSENIN